MSVVGLRDLGADKSKLGAVGGKGRAISMREENDSRRIRSNQEDTKAISVGRPSTAPYTPAQSGPGDLEGLNIEGPKQKAFTVAKKKSAAEASAAPIIKPSRSTSPDAWPAGVSKNGNAGVRATTPKRASSPSRGRTRNRVDFTDSISTTVSIDPNNANINTTLAKRLAVNDVLSERDQAALKMGRLVMNTVMGNPDLTTDDSISRFFFDNWLAKSGSTRAQADTYSIELMSHLQAQIAQARAEAPFLIETPRPAMAGEEGDDLTNLDGENDSLEPSTATGKHASFAPSVGAASVTSEITTALGQSSPGKRSGMFKDLPKHIIKSLGENVVHKTVGSVAMEALDRCIMEFGKGNPILHDIKTALIPLIFADGANPDTLDMLNTVPTTSNELDGSKYLPYQTWLEDAHIMFDNCERAQKEVKSASVKTSTLEHEMRIMESKLRKEQARVQPLIDMADDMRNARDEQTAMKEQLVEAMRLVESSLENERDAKLQVQQELEILRKENEVKDVTIFDLTETIAQMERDKLPDIRKEYAEALKDIELLRANEADLQLAVDNFKIMLQSQKEHDTKSQEYLEKEAVRVAEQITALNDDHKALEGEGRLFSAVLSNDDIESTRRIYEPLHLFFTDNPTRALDGMRHTEYLELRDKIYAAETTRLLSSINTLRYDLFEAKEAIQRVIGNYELKIKDIRNQHKSEIAELKAEHEAEINRYKEIVAGLEKKIEVLTETIDTLNTEIVRLNEEWKKTRIDLKKTRQELEDSLGELQKAQLKINYLNDQLIIVADKLKATKEKLEETKEELMDTKNELAETIEELRETNNSLINTKDDLTIRENEIGMLMSDDWMVTKYLRYKALAVKTQAQLDFAKNEIVNLKDKVKLLETEVLELTSEIAAVNYARKQEQEEFERHKEKLEERISDLETTIENLNFVLDTRNNRIEYLQAQYEEESMMAADRYHKAEKVVISLKGTIVEFEQDLADMTADRNDRVMEREALKVELKNMETRAVHAEECTIGNQSLKTWMEDELNNCIDTLTKPKDPNAFDDFGVSPVDLKNSLRRLETEADPPSFIEKVPETLKSKAIDMIVHADMRMRALAETFTDAITSLENALTVSREIISTTQKLHESEEYKEEQSQKQTVSFTSEKSHAQASFGRGNENTSVCGGSMDESQSHLQMIPDGYDIYDRSTHHLVHTETIQQNKEMMLMMKWDLHEMHTDKNHILDHVMEIHGYHYVVPEESEKVLDLEPNSAEESDTADKALVSKSGSSMHNDHTKRILKAAAAAVEAENPLRQRVEKQHAEIIVLENSLEDIKLDKEELVIEVACLEKDLIKANDQIKLLTESLAVMTDRQQQAMLAVEEQEREVVRVKAEAEEGFKKKRDEAHPAVKMQMMAEAAKGNPKKLVQPFLHFLRRNENDVSRHLGTNLIAMREVRGLCNRVNTTIETLLDEEAQYYYRKHQGTDDLSALSNSFMKIWKVLRATKADVAEYTSWVFEGQDISLGNDKIKKALRIDNNNTSFLDPARAVGDNALAAAYENHSRTTAQGEDADVISDEIKEDLVDNLEAVAENLRCDAFRGGDWRMQLYNLDGTVDLDMPVHDWPKDDKIHILDEQLTAAKEKIQQERNLGKNRLDKLKREKNSVEKKLDDIREEILALQKEYGTKGVEHDYVVYKRIKKGILDGSLEKYNLPEVIYSPQDFEDVELGIYSAVQTLIDLCRESGEPEKPPNPFPESEEKKKMVKEAQLSLSPEAKNRIAHVRPMNRPSTAIKKKEQGKEEERLKAEEIGASGMDISNMAFSTVGRLSSSQGTRKPIVPTSGMAIVAPIAGSRSSSGPPPSDWHASLEHKKRTKALAKYHAENQPARFGAYGGSNTSSKRGAPDDSLFQSRAVVEQVVQKVRESNRIDDEGMPLEWSNAKSQDLVNLLNAAVKKVQMRILYAKIIKPSTSRHNSPKRGDRENDTAESRARDAKEKVFPHTDTTANLLDQLGSGMALMPEPMVPDAADHPQLHPSLDVSGRESTNMSVTSTSNADMHELYGDMNDSIVDYSHIDAEGAENAGDDEESELGYLSQHPNSNIAAFAQLPKTAAVDFAKEVFSDGAEIVEEDEKRLESEAFDLNNDISRFVSKLNAKVNKHITSAKLFENIVNELEATRENSGALNITTVNRIFALRTALPVGEESEDMATIMAKLKLQAPPDVLARATHLVRDHHHHLVLEENAERKFVNGPWGGRPRYVAGANGGEPEELAKVQEFETSTTLLERNSIAMAMTRSLDSGSFAGSMNRRRLDKAILDPRVPSTADYYISNVSVANSGSVSNKLKKNMYVKPTAAKVLNVALVPISHSRLETKSDYLQYLQEMQYDKDNVAHQQNIMNAEEEDEEEKGGDSNLMSQQQLRQQQQQQKASHGTHGIGMVVDLSIPGIGNISQVSQGSLGFNEEFNDSMVSSVNIDPHVVEQTGDADDLSYDSHHSYGVSSVYSNKSQRPAIVPTMQVANIDTDTADYKETAASSTRSLNNAVIDNSNPPRPRSPLPPSQLLGLTKEERAL